MYRQEIGSEFDITDCMVDNAVQKDNIIEYLSDYNVEFYDSGRSALLALLEGIEYQTVLLPGYICESVRKCFKDSSNVVYYKINRDFTIDWNDLIEKSKKVDIVYIHYFNGYIDSKYDFDNLHQMKKQNSFVVIEDTTHSLFSEVCTVGDYCICSLRKWFPVADGGVLYSKSKLTHKELLYNQWAENKRLAMFEKGKYISGSISDKKGFLHTFSESEETLDRQMEPYAISQYSYELLKRINYHNLIRSRKRNYEILHEYLKDKALPYASLNQVPLFYVIQVENRDELRKFFINHNIFCPVHWPLYDEIGKLDGAIYLYNKELSIPIDQRYNQRDMLYIVKIYNEYLCQENSK